MKQSKQTSLLKNGFTFKQFFVGHDISPMKVTTDSTLLGAFAPIEPVPKRVIDIGTGCGVIALMLAQRLQAYPDSYIDAVDIDFDAITQCQENILNSPFKRISAYQLDIRKILQNDSNKIALFQQYDLIVCNPPYFESAVACRTNKRQIARYTEQLSHKDLFQCVNYLLSREGVFSVVLPFHLFEQFAQLASQYQLMLQQHLNIKYKPDKNDSLIIGCFIRKEQLNNEDLTTKKNLCMRNEDGSYTPDFARLLKDFYLRF